MNCSRSFGRKPFKVTAFDLENVDWHNSGSDNLECYSVDGGQRLLRSLKKHPISLTFFFFGCNSMNELVIEVNEDGQWIFPDQKAKGRAYSSNTPAFALAHLIAWKLGLKRREGFKFKISKVET